MIKSLLFLKKKRSPNILILDMYKYVFTVLTYVCYEDIVAHEITTISAQ